MTDEWTTLGSATVWQSGGTPSRLNPDYWDGLVPWISAFTLKGTYLCTSDQFLTTAGVAAGSKVAPEGAVLVLVRGMALHSELRAGVAARPLAFNQDVKAMLPTSGVEPEFLLFSLQARESQILKLVTSAGSGTGVLTSDRLKMLPLWIPSIQTQRDICSAIGEADLLIESFAQLLAKKRDVKQGVMQELLTGRTRLPGFTGNWRSRTIGEVANVIMGQSPPGSSYNQAGNGLPLIQGNADIQDRRTVERIWTTSPTKLVGEGDVVLTVRAPVGFTARAHANSCLGRGVCALSSVGSNDFLFHAMVAAEPKWALFEQGSTFTSVNSDQVRSFVLEWPPDDEEQKQIAAIVDDVDAEIHTLERRLESARAVKVGMMQELLTGGTRLPVEEEA